MNQVKTNYDLTELYNLIKENPSHETFINNLEVWTSFYQNRHSYIKNNILDERLYTIIAFLIQQEQGEIFDYFTSELVSSLYKEEGNITFSYRDKLPPQPNNIHNLFKILTNHDTLSDTLKNLEVEDPFGDLKKYQSKQLELFITDSLIVNTYQTFFELDPETARKTIEFITKNSCLLQKDEVGKQPLNTDLIHQYQDKIIPIEIFLGKDIREDRLIKEILTYEIKDKKIVENLFKKLPIKRILSIFEGKLPKLLEFIEKANYLDNDEKQKLANQMFNKIEEKYYNFFLDLIVENYQNPLWNHYRTDEFQKKIITWAMNQNPLSLNDQAIKFLLNNPEVNLNFLKNVIVLLQQEELKQKGQLDFEGISKEVQKYLNNTYPKLQLIEKEFLIKETDTIQIKLQKSMFYELQGKRLEFTTCIELLQAYFEERIELNEYSACTIIRSLATYTLENLNITHHGVYFYQNQESNGEFADETKTIGINIARINHFIDKNKSTYERLQVFATMFHEIKHAMVNQNKENNIWNFDAYKMEKERIIGDYDDDFYETNYWNFKEEISARIAGFEYLFKFIETFFPTLLDKIQDEIIANLEAENNRNRKQSEEDQMKFLKNIELKFNQGFDTLIKYNPDILNQHPILSLEYYPNGIPKTDTDIELGKIKENESLIDGVLKTRYPDSEDTQKRKFK